jgi:hypothetical protein
VCTHCSGLNTRSQQALPEYLDDVKVAGVAVQLLARSPDGALFRAVFSDSLKVLRPKLSSSAAGFEDVQQGQSSNPALSLYSRSRVSSSTKVSAQHACGAICAAAPLYLFLPHSTHALFLVRMRVVDRSATC